ncbi:MAG: sugar phosphate isomerase/epimerase family protein [Microbacterium sp.]
MQIGCHGLTWIGSFDPEGFDVALRKTEEAGFDLLEIPLFDPAGFDVAHAKKALKASPLALTASLGLGADTDINCEDAEQTARGRALLFRAVEVMAECESEHLVGALFSALRKYPEPATAEARKNSAQVIHDLSERGAELGVQIGLEIVNRYETNLFNTVKEGLEFLDLVDHPNAGLHIDTYHMNIEESDMVLPVIKGADRISYVHIGESHRGYLGSGSVDFDSLFRALTHIGYDGVITFESFSSAVVNKDLSNTLAIWRNLWTDSDDLGAHANRFIRDGLRSAAAAAGH